MITCCAFHVGVVHVTSGCFRRTCGVCGCCRQEVRFSQQTKMTKELTVSWRRDRQSQDSEWFGTLKQAEHSFLSLEELFHIIWHEEHIGTVSQIPTPPTPRIILQHVWRNNNPPPFRIISLFVIRKSATEPLMESLYFYTGYVLSLSLLSAQKLSVVSCDVSKNCVTWKSVLLVLLHPA